MLTASNLTVRYFGRRNPALRDVTFSIGQGERVLLMGPSGSGKSTLALALAGLVPDSVDAELSGQLLASTVGSGMHGGSGPRAGIVFQDPTSQFAMLHVDDEVAFGLENLGVPPDEMRSRVAAALGAMGLQQRERWLLDHLSGGQQQRVAIASALAMHPSILVLDEPTAHLDARSGLGLYQLLTGLALSQALTLVVAEHDLDVLPPDLIDRCLLLDGGRLVGDGSPYTVFGSRQTALRCHELGVWLPTSVALALALDANEPLPLTEAGAARWIAEEPSVQARLRSAASRRRTPGSGRVVLAAQGVSHRYPRSPQGQLTLARVDLGVREGELVAIVGANGSGKTTLLRVLSGLLPVAEGTVSLDGARLDGRSGTATRRIGHVFQNPEAGFVANSVADELAYAPRALGRTADEVDRLIASALERYNLAAVARANPFTLSEGQKRRLSVAASLIEKPRVLFLDEPTYGQDRRSALALLDQIAALRDEGLAIVLATHDLGLVTEIADRVVALIDGHVAFDGPPDVLLTQDSLVQSAGQRPPALWRILARARSLGADVPLSIRWRNLDPMAGPELGGGTPRVSVVAS